MKAERIESKQIFVPVIITLESQEEVDALFVMGNDIRICAVFPALDGMYNALKHFTSDGFQTLRDRISELLD